MNLEGRNGRLLLGAMVAMGLSAPPALASWHVQARGPDVFGKVNVTAWDNGSHGQLTIECTVSKPNSQGIRTSIKRILT
jgi:hypothetical protein